MKFRGQKSCFMCYFKFDGDDDDDEEVDKDDEEEEEEREEYILIREQLLTCVVHLRDKAEEEEARYRDFSCIVSNRI